MIFKNDDSRLRSVSSVILVTSLVMVVIMTISAVAGASGTWAPVGLGLDGTSATRLHVWDGKLIVIGDFHTAGGIAVNNIAAWNGVMWTALGAGWESPPATVLTLDALLVVRGIRSGGVPEIAAWDGSVWTTIVEGSYSGVVSFQGKLHYSSGGFLQQWDGVAWISVHEWNNGVGLIIGVSDALLYTLGPASMIGSFDGISWTPLGSTGFDFDVSVVKANGQLFASGRNDITWPIVSAWNGSEWDQIFSSSEPWLCGGPKSPIEYNGKLIVADIFSDVCGPPFTRVASWDGAVWGPVGGDLNGGVGAIVDYNGKLIVAGNFTEASGVPASMIAQLEVSTPVAISGFRAKPLRDSIELSWRIVADERFDGFYVYRSTGGGVDVLMNTAMLSSEARSFMDHTAAPGMRYSYQLVAVGAETGDVRSQRATVALPKLTASLRQNIPNPFNPSTTIRFVVPEQDNVTITVYGPDGQKVRTLVDQSYAPGEHATAWDGTDQGGKRVASGVYYYRMRIGKIIQSKKMLLLK